jgi:hypothetical protein
MDPLKPLGKALSQNPLLGNDVPLSAPPGVAPEKPISAFQWMSLAKATWTWILRPIWYLCFQWPAQLLGMGMATPKGGLDDRRSNWQRDHERQLHENRIAEWRRNTSQD